jgi:hypothetical protein
MIIGLSGYARSGKDTVADHLVNVYGFSQKSFAAKMKEAMYILNPIIHSDEIGPMRYQSLVDVYGLDYVKDHYPEARRLLQVFGTEVGRSMFGSDFWVNLTLDEVHSFHTVISDVRFKNEADAIKAQGGQIWRVNRSGITPVAAHSSEVDLDDYTFDKVLDNNQSILDLYKLVDLALANESN